MVNGIPFYKWLTLLTRAELETFVHFCALRSSPPTAVSAVLWIRYEKAKQTRSP